VNLDWTDDFTRDMRRLPIQLQRQALQKLALLKTNLAHPSLRVKKMRGVGDVYEGSINMSYRFIFEIDGERLVLLRIGPHKVLDDI
jgi:mRNA interferase RelE/StbE